MSAIDRFESLYEEKPNRLLKKYKKLYERLDKMFDVKQTFSSCIKYDDINDRIENIKDICATLVQRLVCNKKTIDEIASKVNFEKELIIDLNKEILLENFNYDTYEILDFESEYDQA